MFSSTSYFETLEDPVIVTGTNNRCLFVNTAFCDLFGGTSEAWLEKYFDPHHPDYKCDEKVHTSVSNSVITKFKKNGTAHVIVWQETHIDETQTVFRGQDISGQLKNERELTNLANTAEEASNAKMRFLATMSHEMRTPLNGILGIAGLLRESEMDEHQRAYTDAISESGSALLALINDILDFSKVDAGKVELEEILFDPRNIIQGVLELLCTKSAHKGLEIAAYIDPSLPERVLGDETRLRQILLNLVGNAIKFTSNGGVALELHCSPAQIPDFINLRIDIRDTGIGIPENAFEKIFEEFTQADSSTTRKYEGTGLGLAIARKISHAMGGELSVQSEVGIGSTFSITMAMKLADGFAFQENREKIDDDIILLTTSKLLRDVTFKQLNAIGVQNVQFFESTTQCLEVLKNNPNTTLLCDLSFAVTHGAKLTKAANHTLVLVSPVARGRLDTFRKIGFSGYLIKPIRQVSLRDRIIDKSVFENQQTIATTAKATTHIAATETVSSKSSNNKKDDTPQTEKITQNISASESSSKSTIRYRILLAEDNRINAILATTVIKKSGHDVDVAENGMEAIDLLQSADYDLVLMDMRMPIMDGIDATKSIRKMNTSFTNIPIIALTANTTRDDRDTCSAAGMNDFLTKPFDPGDLVRMVEKWIEVPKEDKTQDQSVNL